MTSTSHVYRAWLISTPDVELPLKSGTVTLDAGQAPHVSASLVVSAPGVWEFTPIEYPDGEGFGYGEGPYGGGGYGGWGLEWTFTPDDIALAALDPRLNARVRIDVEMIDLFGGMVSRSFDLGLRSRSIQHRDAAISLELASDEALLIDYAQTSDDDMRAYQTSLRDVIDAVLDTAIPGAALEASPSLDADVTVYWEETNLVANPNGVNTTGTHEGTGASASIASSFSGDDALRWTNAAGTTGMFLAGWDDSSSTFKGIPADPGMPYVATAKLASSVARSAFIRLEFYAADNTFISSVSSSTATTSTSAWTQYHVIATAPKSAAYANVEAVTASNSAGQFHYSREVMIYQDNEIVTYFDGDTVDGTNGYDYAWSGDPDLSTSTRTPIIDRPREALVWLAGQSAMDFLMPLFQAQGWRLVCDESRAWTLRDEDYLAAGAVSIRHAVNLTDADETISRDSGIWFDAALTRYTWTDRQGIEQIKTDGYVLTTPHTLLHLFERDTPYPGPGFSQYAVRRAQQVGREVGASSVSDWMASAEQSVTIYLDDTPTQTGKSESIVFDLSNDEMTVTARTQDTPDGSINGLSGTIDALAGTINAL